MSNTSRGRRNWLAVVIVALVATGCATSVDTGAPVVRPAGATSTTTPQSSSTSTKPTATSATSGPTSAPSASTVAWSTCSDDLLGGTVDSSIVDCATLAVPLDYTQPDGKTIDIAMIRWPAPKGAKRIGSLLINPGGPGGSGQDFLTGIVSRNEAKLADLHEGFDIIGFDPRGVNGSGGLSCVDGPTLDEAFSIDQTPDTPAEVKTKKDYEDLVKNACKAKYSEDFLKQINTESTARDMDRIRIAVGDAKLTYLGVSYGTYLGSVYATLFPDKVRSLVLDGAFDPAGEDELTSNLIQIKGFEGAFKNWEDWCATSPVCAFGPNDIDKRWMELRQKLDDNPIKGDGTRTVNQSTFVSATITALYEKAQGWPAIGAALKAAEDGDGSMLLTLADSQAGRKDDGTYDSIGTSFGVISCTSGLVGKAPADKEAAAAQIRAASPHFGFDSTAESFGNSCAGVPEAPNPTMFSYTGSGPILVIGGKNDPATPYVWAEKMAKDLGPKASLVSYNGEGHSTWLESDCADALINAALLKLVSIGTKDCAAQGKIAVGIPTWLNELPTIAGVLPIDISDLGPLLGLERSGYQGRVVLSTQGSTEAVRSATTALTAAGWKNEGGQNGARNFTKTIGGSPADLTVIPIGLADLSGQPFAGIIAEKLAASGKTMLFLGTQL